MLFYALKPICIYQFNRKLNRRESSSYNWSFVLSVKICENKNTVRNSNIRASSVRGQKMWDTSICIWNRYVLFWKQKCVCVLLNNTIRPIWMKQYFICGSSDKRYDYKRISVHKRTHISNNYFILCLIKDSYNGETVILCERFETNSIYVFLISLLSRTLSDCVLLYKTEYRDIYLFEFNA